MKRPRYRTFSISGLHSITLADLKVPDEIYLIHDYSKQRERRHVGSADPLAVLMPYAMFQAWQDLFLRVSAQLTELKGSFEKFRPEENS